jgi:hypothetical protein
MVARARRGEGPGFLLANTYRFRGHHVGDISRDYYRSKQEEQRWMSERDPLPLYAGWLTSEGLADQATLERIQSEVAAEWMPRSSSHRTRRFPIRDGSTRISMPDTVATAQRPQASGAAVRELTFAEAIREALAEEMRRDPTVVLLGEDVAEAGTPFKVVKGLVEQFGKDRVVDTPISRRDSLAWRSAPRWRHAPVVDIMFGDFMTLIMDQVVNQAAKIHYMSGGKWKVPMVIRATMGATRRSAAQHSQSLHAWPSHVPGLKVAIPSTPYDAKGLIKAAIRDDNPVVVFEDKISYMKVKGPVPPRST